MSTLYIHGKDNPEPQKHNYYAKLMALIEEGKIKPGDVNLVRIFHDDWCAIYEGGWCNCDPDVVFEGVQGV